jgi:hypothetical protein
VACILLGDCGELGAVTEVAVATAQNVTGEEERGADSIRVFVDRSECPMMLRTECSPR